MDEREKQAREAVGLLAAYLGIRRCAGIGLPDHPEKAAKDFDETKGFLVKLFSALQESVNEMERDHEELYHSGVSFDIRVAIAKEIALREKMLRQLNLLLAS
jgi:hypothetical protein